MLTYELPMLSHSNFKKNCQLFDIKIEITVTKVNPFEDFNDKILTF